MCVCSVTQSCPTLCNPMDCSLPGSPVRGVFQARLLEWVPFSFSRGFSYFRDETQVFCISCIGRWILYLLSHQGSPDTRLLCPWDFTGKNTGVGCLSLLQGTFLTQGSNPSLLHLLHWQVDSLPVGKESPRK